MGQMVPLRLSLRPDPNLGADGAQAARNDRYVRRAALERRPHLVRVRVRVRERRAHVLDREGHISPISLLYPPYISPISAHVLDREGAHAEDHDALAPPVGPLG